MTILLPLIAETIQRLTYDLVRYSARCDRACVEQLGITGSQGYTLLAIPSSETITMNDLSLKMKVANSTMTRMVDQLVQKGMADRGPDVYDRRVVRVCLTEAGAQAQKQLRETFRSFFTWISQEIPENEREAAVHGLETLNQAIARTLRSCCGADNDV